MERTAYFKLLLLAKPINLEELILEIIQLSPKDTEYKIWRLNSIF